MVPVVDTTPYFIIMVLLITAFCLRWENRSRSDWANERQGGLYLRAAGSDAASTSHPVRSNAGNSWLLIVT